MLSLILFNSVDFSKMVGDIFLKRFKDSQRYKINNLMNNNDSLSFTKLPNIDIIIRLTVS